MEINNFTTDFSQRCKIVYLYFKDDCRKNLEKEVTFLLMLLASSFVIPFEVLKKEKAPRSERKTHLQSEGDKCKRKSSLLKNIHFEKRIMTCSKPVAKFYSGSEKGSAVDMTLSAFLRIIRNALAHGNIESLPNGTGAIHSLVFFREDMKDIVSLTDEKEQIKDRIFCGYVGVEISINDLEQFAFEWIEFVEKYPREAQDLLHDAA